MTRAWNAMLLMDSFDMEEDFKHERYSPIRSSLKDICQQLHVDTSNPTPSRVTSTTSQRTTSSTPQRTTSSTPQRTTSSTPQRTPSSTTQRATSSTTQRATSTPKEENEVEEFFTRLGCALASAVRFVVQIGVVIAIIIGVLHLIFEN